VGAKQSVRARTFFPSVFSGSIHAKSPSHALLNWTACHHMKSSAGSMTP
jgi:hypothetical protein